MRSLRNLIGTDCAERIWITTRREAWLDEDGASAENPINQAATRLAHTFGWQFSLCGAVVIIGLGEETAPAALSPEQVDAILTMTGSAP